MKNSQICMQKITQCKILFAYKTKKNVLKQIYTVDTQKEILINGNNQKGYMLNIWPENIPSNTCITYTDLLYLLRGDTIKQHVFNVQIIN